MKNSPRRKPSLGDDETTAGNDKPTAGDDDNDGLDIGAIVVITAGATIVVCAGIIALIWFGIGKKTWADLLAVFKK